MQPVTVTLHHNNCKLSVPNHDDVLNETYTDHDGHFFVHGTTLEVNHIEPIVKVYHDCLLNGLVSLLDQWSAYFDSPFECEL